MDWKNGKECEIPMSFLFEQFLDRTDPKSMWSLESAPKIELIVVFVGEFIL